MESGKEQNENIVELYATRADTEMRLPFVDAAISAGFPSPALDFEDQQIDLNEHLIRHPSATFYGRVKGESMINAGVGDGDILVIDRSLEPEHGKIAVCFIDGEFTAKRIHVSGGKLLLMPENTKFKPIQVSEESNLKIWGIVTYVIKQV